MSPEEMEKEMKEQRAVDKEDAEYLRQVVEDVREAKRRGTWEGPPSVKSVEEQMRLQNGVQSAVDRASDDANSDNSSE